MSTRIAFASNDGQHVDEHFGSAGRFHLFTLTPEGSHHSAVIDCETGEGHDSGRLTQRIAALTGCQIVHCTEIGQGALRQLRAAGIEARRVPDGSRIADLLSDWLAGKIAAPTTSDDHKRFDRFLDEGWPS